MSALLTIDTIITTVITIIAVFLSFITIAEEVTFLEASRCAQENGWEAQHMWTVAVEVLSKFSKGVVIVCKSTTHHDNDGSYLN